MKPTEQDKELFELCKRVYKATWWDDTQNGYYHIDGKEPLLYDKDNFDMHKEPWWSQMAYLSPAYTSDYLLERLPLEKGNYIGLQIWSGGNWGASWQPSRGKRHTLAVDDTPLKALLKLTLKLHGEGLL